MEIRRISTSLYGTAPELIRHYIEIRGVGVIDVQQLFGMGAVQFDTEIDLVVQLEQWKDGKFYDRLGLGEETYEILGEAAVHDCSRSSGQKPGRHRGDRHHEKPPNEIRLQPCPGFCDPA